MITIFCGTGFVPGSLDYSCVKTDSFQRDNIVEMVLLTLLVFHCEGLIDYYYLSDLHAADCITIQEVEISDLGLTYPSSFGIFHEALITASKGSCYIRQSYCCNSWGWNILGGVLQHLELPLNMPLLLVKGLATRNLGTAAIHETSIHQS